MIDRLALGEEPRKRAPDAEYIAPARSRVVSVIITPTPRSRAPLGGACEREREIYIDDLG